MSDKDIHAAAIEAAEAAKASVAPGEDFGEDNAPPDVPLTRGQKLRLVGLVILKRVRFIAVLAGVGLFIGYWDTVMNYWDKWTQPRSVACARIGAGPGVLLPDGPASGPLDLRAQRRRAEMPDLRNAAVDPQERAKPEAAGGHHRPRATLAGANPTGGHQDRAVEYRPVARQTKTVGYVTFDESRLSRIVSRVDGYVEKLYVDKTFTVVHKGDPLAEIYSPELYSTAQELVLATRGTGVADMAAAARTSSCSWASASRKSTASWPRGSRRRGW